MVKKHTIKLNKGAIRHRHEKNKCMTDIPFLEEIQKTKKIHENVFKNFLKVSKQKNVHS